MALFSVFLLSVAFITTTMTSFTYGTPLTNESGASGEDTSDQQEPNQLTSAEETESGLVAPSENDDQRSITYI